MGLTITFNEGKAWIEHYNNCSGISGIQGVGTVSFSAPDETDESLLGSPFLPECPSLGYQGKDRHLANALHESIHYRLCEALMHTVSPNHTVLCRDINDSETCKVWRCFEEQMIVSVQYCLNTGIFPRVIEPWIREDYQRVKALRDVVKWAHDLRRVLRHHATDCKTFHDLFRRNC